MLFRSGSGIQYKITPKSGYTISAVYVDGTPVGAVSSYNFTDVKGDHSISVDFAAIPGQESAPPKPEETAKPDNTDTETSPAPDKTQPEKKPEEQPKQPEPSKENGLTGTLKMLDISVEEAEKLIDEGNDRELMEGALQTGDLQVTIHNDFADPTDRKSVCRERVDRKSVV